MKKNKHQFSHLHVHTEYSLLQSTIKLDDLFQKCREYQMDSVAITDLGTMFGVAEFYDRALKESIKPVIGCEFYVAPRTIQNRTHSDNKGLSHLALLAKNQEGYSNLCKLASIAHLQGFYHKPRVDKELLSNYSKGLIAFSPCIKGEVSKNIIQNKLDKADEIAQFYQKIFGENNFYLAIQETGMDMGRYVNQGIHDMHKRLSIPMVATNSCYYLTKDDYSTHEILLCIKTGDTLSNPDRYKFDSDQLYFKSPDEMNEAFSQFPEAIKNTGKIASECNVELDYKSYHIPKVTISDDESDDELFRRKVMEGLEAKLKIIKNKNPSINEKLYKNRLKYEVELITKKGFSSYFLIIADLIDHSRNINVLVGPGRGSATGSLVNYSLGITALDPIEHDLIFERFYNFTHTGMPVIDIDFCSEGKNLIIDYVTGRYGGSEYVSGVATFYKLRSHSVIKNVGRMLGIPLPAVDVICKMIPYNIRNLSKAMELVPEIKEKCAKSKIKMQMIEISQCLEGLRRDISIHATGIVVSDKPLNEYLPLYKREKGGTVTQFEMDYVEKLGLVKFNFLGLRTLTVIKKCIELIKQKGKTPPDLLNLDYTDVKTFEMLQRADTEGVFQLESSGMKNLISRLKPTNFSDIVALLTLYRSGPLNSGMTDTYVQRKNGQEKVVYFFEELKPILKETYGLILYQEQVMKIATVIANYSMGDADGLRKAMGENIIFIMEEHKARFLKGAKENNHDPQKAAELFDSMEKFSGCIFNKSHSAAYALIAYQTAYLKANYSAEYHFDMPS
jgi:DNA polymerase III subunit alpha